MQIVQNVALVVHNYFGLYLQKGWLLRTFMLINQHINTMKRKSCLTVILVVMISFLSHAQIEKGNVFFGGSSNLGFTAGAQKIKSGSTTADGYKYSSFDFQPMAGYFIIDKLPVGLFVDLSMSSQKFDDPKMEYSYSYALVGPFARYYVTDINGLMPYGEVRFGVGSGKTKSVYMGSENEEKYSLLHFAIGIGGTYFVTENVGVDLLINYGVDSEKWDAEPNGERSEGDKVTYSYSGIGFKLGFVISLGN